MRAGPALACGIVIGTAFAALVGFGFLRLWSPMARAPAQSPVSAPLEQPSADRAAVPSVPIAPAAMPSRSWYGPRAEEPRPIYRCKADGRTTYSNEPCPGGDLVPGTTAAAGFDTRPSDRMTRLVAQGRDTSSDGVAPATRIVASDPPSSGSTTCATMRRQIVDIDHQTLRPTDQRTLDYWRQVRQDVRTSMAREHC